MKKFWVLAVVLALSGCDDGPKPLSAYQLEHWNKDCSTAESDMFTLVQTEKMVVWSSYDPDILTDDQRHYKALLKSTIWWYVSRCGADYSY